MSVEVRSQGTVLIGIWCTIFLKVQQGWLRIPNTGSMPENKCTAWYVRETQIFSEFVHMDGEKEYKQMITKIKEIASEFSDVEKACVPTV